MYEVRNAKWQQLIANMKSNNVNCVQITNTRTYKSISILKTVRHNINVVNGNVVTGHDSIKLADMHLTESNEIEVSETNGN